MDLGPCKKGGQYEQSWQPQCNQKYKEFVTKADLTHHQLEDELWAKVNEYFKKKNAQKHIQTFNFEVYVLPYS
jgi:uncharacterized HAD superfamily protein